MTPAQRADFPTVELRFRSEKKGVKQDLYFITFDEEIESLADWMHLPGPGSHRYGVSVVSWQRNY